ncbi:MAG: hypothetical protein AAF542_16410 [Pseudomonadota bacterium]
MSARIASPRLPNKPNFARRQRGSTSTEWTVATLILLAALCVPAGANGQSVMGFMMESLQNFHKHTTYVYSLP